MQHTSHLLMIRPVHFDFNAQTAVNNYFQSAAADKENVQQQALSEFENFIAVLRENKIDVTVIEDTTDPHTPDSVFPNNWISFHEDGTVVLYPMFAENRRKEKKQHVLDFIRHSFTVKKIIDLSWYEPRNIFLEGTGSMVLDRENKIAYACLSPRTDKEALDDFCSQMKYKPVCFTATDPSGQPIYHTNVMMCVADEYAVICLESIANEEEKKSVTDALIKTGKHIIAISFEQMNHFAGNMLQVHNSDGKKFIVMSTQARQSLTEQQQLAIEHFNTVIDAGISNIETNGGGSARCMMAEIFLPVKEMQSY